ncbi:MAG TPA: ComEC/Rec2 family competence protein [Phycisphaerae bacterium]|nr:ComEC/Rec2 family competence protein [Phycisphaerae bacterium]
MPVAIGMMIGIIADYYLAPSSVVCWAALLVGLAIALIWKNVRSAALAGLVLASAPVGAMRHDLAFRQLPANHIYNFSRPESFIAHITGTIASIPQIIEPDPAGSRAFDTGPRTKFVLEVQSIDGLSGPISAEGKVAVSIRAPVLLAAVGDTVAMTGWLFRPRGPQNPGDYDRALDLRRSGIRVAFSADHAESVKIISRPAATQTGLGPILARIRLRLARYLVHDAFDDEDAGAGVMQAVVLGQRGAVPKAMNEAFIRTGNAHFLAASGMNVAWLAIMVWVVMRLLGVYYRTTAIVLAILIVSYTLAAEPEPSILRAGTMGILGCLALLVRGRPSVLNWLACSAIVVLMVDPCDLFRPGFQLSFLAVIAVMHVTPRILAFLEGSRWIRQRALSPLGIWGSNSAFPLAVLVAGEESDMERWPKFLARQFCRAALLAFCVSVACTLTTAPLTCYQFNQVSLWAPLSTFILWLPAFIATLIGYAKVTLGMLIPSSAIMFGPLLAASTTVMTATVDLLSKFPHALIDGRSPSAVWVITCYAALAFWLYLPRREKPQDEAQRADSKVSMFRRLDFLIFPLALVLIAWWLIPPRWITHDPKVLQVWMLAVGDGSANVIETPDNHVYICDFGTRSAFDAGNTATSFLKARGIARIDACIISHADFDHYGAIPRIAREFSVGRIILNDQFEPSARGKPAVTKFLADMREEQIPIETITGPAKLFDENGVTMETLWPPPVVAGLMKHDNDASTVLRISYEGRSILLPGDIAEAAMSQLISRELRADVLNLPHHGSVVHNTKPFIDAVNPQFCIRSTSQRKSMTLNGIEEAVAPRKYLTTADSGCILVEIRDGKISARPVMARAD